MSTQKTGFFVILLVLQAGRSFADDPAHACSSARPTEALAAVDSLLEHMKQRFERVEDEAKAKYDQKKPVEDPNRDKKILESAATNARKASIDGALAKSFVQAQIDAGKLMQQKLFERWKKELVDGYDDTQELENETWPQLDLLDEQLLNDFAKISRASKCVNFCEALNARVPEILGKAAEADILRLALKPLLEMSTVGDDTGCCHLNLDLDNKSN